MAEQDQRNDPNDTEGAAQRLLQQQHLRKTLSWLADKQEVGLSEEEIRSTLISIRMPRSRLVKLPGSTAARSIINSDNDSSDSIIGIDFDGVDPLIWRSDRDWDDPSKSPFPLPLP
jgi:hypothetical protein